MTRLDHFTRLSDLGPDGVRAVLARAAAWKAKDPGAVLPGRLLGMVFFNPSLRTRASFEAAMLRSGGHAIVLEVGGNVWKLEDRDGVVMDGDRAEHVREAVPVLSRYVDALAVRTFAALKDFDEDERDPVMNAFRRFATVPVVNMESAREHPCQGLADLLTLRERFGRTEGLRVTLTWAPHIKPLPQAVPGSFLLSAAAAGCHVTLAHPPGFALHPAVMAEAEAYAAQTGGSVSFAGDQAAAVEGSAAVYAKSWAPLAATADPAEQTALLQRHRDWMVTPALMDRARAEAVFLHCLPVRRNVVVADGVLDGPRSVVVDEAENRYHVQRAVLSYLLNHE
jgi:N-acetylornithine carbamoyltransferase